MMKDIIICNSLLLDIVKYLISKKKYYIILFLVLINQSFIHSQNDNIKINIPDSYQSNYPDNTDGYSFLNDTTWLTDHVLIEQDAEIEQLWWQNLNDQLLDSLINIAFKDNYNLLIAQQRIIQSRESMRSAFAGFLPSFTASAGWQRSRSSQTTSPMSLLSPKYTSYYSGSIAMNWELDVFGSIRKKYMEQKNLYKASKMDYNSTMISLAQSVASAYINVLTSQRLIYVMKTNIASQKEIVDITEARFQAGLSSQLDVAQAKSTYYSTRASITSIESGYANYINSLSVLLGMVPSELVPVFDSIKPLPQAATIVPVSIPASLLRQRPDIIAAEYQVKAQADALGVAIKDWFPSFFLKGSFGVSSHEMHNLFRDKSMVWQIAPAVTWTIFNGGQRDAAIRSAESVLQQYIDNYNLTILTALQEVDNAIVSYKNSVRETQEYKTAVTEALNALNLSMELYKMGLSTFINVQNSLQTLLSYELSLAKSEGNSLIYLITLYQALGGGWQIQ